MRHETGWFGQNFYYYEEIDSTNIKAKEMAKDGAPHGAVVAAGSRPPGGEDAGGAGIRRMARTCICLL